MEQNVAKANNSTEASQGTCGAAWFLRLLYDYCCHYCSHMAVTILYITSSISIIVAAVCAIIVLFVGGLAVALAMVVVHRCCGRRRRCHRCCC